MAELVDDALTAIMAEVLRPRPDDEPVCASGCIGGCEGHDGEND